MINTIKAQLAPDEINILDGSTYIGNALAQYHNIVKEVAEDYTDDTTAEELRADHPELDFMGDDEIADILNYARKRRN